MGSNRDDGMINNKYLALGPSPLEFLSDQLAYNAIFETPPDCLHHGSPFSAVDPEDGFGI